MDMSWLTSLTTFAFAMAATPGPNNTMVAASGANYGVARSLPLNAGIAFGVAAIMLAVSAFGASIISNPMVNATLKWIGAGYILWLAWKIASMEPRLDIREAGSNNESVPMSFSQGALFQFVNPKLWVMVAGSVVTYGSAATTLGELQLALIFAFIFGLMTFLSVIAWTVLGRSIGKFLLSENAFRVFNWFMAALLVVSLIPVLFD